jgi:V-type H+-transporting ATPase subunit C
MEHWLISFKSSQSESANLWHSLRNDQLNKHLCGTHTFNIDQQFKSGSLDSLVAVADELSRLDHQLESSLRKIERQCFDLDPNPSLTICLPSKDNKDNKEYVTTSNYLANFKWDVTKYAPSNSLSELAQLIEDRLHKLDDDVKAQTAKFVEQRNALSQVSKRDTGGLASRDLNEVLTVEVCNAGDFINSEYLKTLVVAVPKKDIETWLREYEFLSDRVVPGSAKQFNVEDKDNLTLWRVVILKVGLDEVVAKAKKSRWVIREFDFNPDQTEINKKQVDELKAEFAKKQAILLGLCKSVFSELFIALVHLKALRIYGESILRYSLPPQFFSVIVTPKDGKQKKILDGLVKRFMKSGEKADVYCTKEESEDGEDFFPFVFIRMPKFSDS